MMARMFKPPKSAPRPAENKAVHAKERKTAAGQSIDLDIAGSQLFCQGFCKTVESGFGSGVGGFAGSPGKGRSVNSPSDGKSLSEGFYLEVSCWP